MKRFIQIFALLVVAMTSLSVLACGKKVKVSTDDAVLATKLLIEEFVADVKTTVYNHLDEVRSNLIRQSDELVNDFFIRDNITTYGINMNQPARLPTPLGKNQIQEVVDSFTILIDSKTLKDEINKLASNTDKYSILIHDYKIVSNIFFEPNSFAMIYVDDETFLANASILLVINYNYLDYNKSVVNAFVRNYINLGITGDSSIKKGVVLLENNLASELINDDSSVVWNTGTEFNYQNEEFYKAFELYHDQKRTRKLNNLLDSEVWQKKLDQFIIDKKYFGENSNLGLEVDFSSKEIKSDRLLSKLEAINHVSTPRTYHESLPLRQTILQKYEGKDNLNFISGTIQGNHEIYNILNASFKQTYVNFKNKTKEFLIDYQGDNLNNDNILFGEVVIEGLALNFKNLNFILPMNTFALNYSFSLTGKNFDIDSKGALNQSPLGEAVYKNCVAGIKSFQNNFGVEGPAPNNPKSRFKRVSSGKIEYLRIPFIFTGTRSDQPLTVNIFEELKTNVNLLTSGSSSWSIFNQILSLETNALAPVRYNLLSDGYQGNFGFTVKNLFRSANFLFDKNLYIPDNNGFISLWLGKANESKNQNVYSFGGVKGFQSTAKKYVSFNKGFELNLSLLNIYVSLPEINYGLGNGILLNERSEYQYAFGYSILISKI